MTIVIDHTPDTYDIDGLLVRRWAGTLPDGTPVDVIVQSVRPKHSATAQQVDAVTKYMKAFGAKDSNLREYTRVTNNTPTE